MDHLESTPGLKTINTLKNIHAVNTAFTHAIVYYDRVKQKNVLTRSSLELIALFIRTLIFAATPLANLVKKPIISVDSYVCDKLNELTQSYLSISKPTEQVTGIYIYKYAICDISLNLIINISHIKANGKSLCAVERTV